LTGRGRRTALDEKQRRERRIRRLGDELLDEGVSLPADVVLLEELDYARHPPLHEGVAPRFGALVSGGDRFPLGRLPSAASVQEITGDVGVARKLADGRTTFLARSAGGDAHLVCLDRALEYESTALDVATDAGVYVVQRRQTGWVRVCGPAGVVIWDGTRWAIKPRAERLADAVLRAVRGAEPRVAVGLLRLCLHWLSANRVGALLVWSPHGDPRLLDRVGLGASIAVPRMDVTCGDHLPALVNVLAQVDRAALVAPHGTIDTLGVALRPTRASIDAVEPFGGTRHTSAQRYSFDHDDCVVFVVSAAGPMTVFHRGTPIAASGPGAVAALG
jgi:DNA integrity scanning protein DisA with diadenylate cyclase activity